MRDKSLCWLATLTLLCSAATTRAEPVRVTVKGACPAADLAERTARELRLEGFEPTSGEEGSAELEIHHLCGGGYVILIRDPARDSVLREQIDDAPLEDVVIHAVELLRTVTNGEASSSQPDVEAPAQACEAPTTIEVGPSDPELAAWEEAYSVARSPQCQKKCWHKGQCKYEDSSCIASGDADCLQSKGCREHGRCREVAGQCLAMQDRDCRRATVCREHKRCTADVEEHKCVDERPRRSRGVLAGSIVGVSLSGVALFAGIAVLAMSGRSHSEDSTSILPGILLLAGVAAPGIPLSIAGMVYGGSRVSEGDADYRPTVSLSPTGASLTWRF